MPSTATSPPRAAACRLRRPAYRPEPRISRACCARSKRPKTRPRPRTDNFVRCGLPRFPRSGYGSGMDLEFSKEELAFRDEVRSFVDKKLPAEIRDKVDQGKPLTRQEHIDWQKILAEKGWSAPNWPV